MAEISGNDLLDDSEVSSEQGMDGLYFCFEVDSEGYAIEVINVKEIINVCSITPVPESPEYLKGIINLRGDIIPVIDVRLRFGKLEKPYDDLTCIAVILFEDYAIGLIVDSVEGVLPITEDQIFPPPSARLAHGNYFVKSVAHLANDIKLLLDIEKLLF